jgi:hypothetical protein
VAIVVEESGVPPPPVIEMEESGVLHLPVTSAAVEEGRATVETATKRCQSHQPGLARAMLTW